MNNPSAEPLIALVGNPNCGKTTLFNALTGAVQRVGNWSGVTVERKMGYSEVDGKKLAIVDLPGTYSLTALGEEGPQDETITTDFLKKTPPALVLNVVDAINLERNLYLSIQLIEQQLPLVIALNRMDLAQKQGVSIDHAALASKLGCPVVPLVARRGIGVEALKKALVATTPVTLAIAYPPAVETQIALLTKIYTEMFGHSAPRYQLLRWLEGERLPCGIDLETEIAKAQKTILLQTGQTPDVLIAIARYAFIESIVAKIKHTPATTQHNVQKYLDKIICHRFLGLPIFLGVMYSLFFFAINIGGAFQDFFELSSDAIFVEGVAHFLQQVQAPEWLMALLVSGFGKGISTLFTFVPVIGAMFFALAFLEDCGYMARAAFVMDRVMRAIGLPGKSFVPMIVGFGCNVPAIMGTRTLENKRDRILAVMMSPFMSCGARLAIFTVFVAAFFPSGGQNIVFLLYIIGIAMALLTGWLLKKTLLKGEVSPLVLEMPNYQWPHWRSLWLHCWHRLRRFIVNAGKLILPVCVLLGVLNSISLDGKWLSTPDHSSVLSQVGQKLVPIFKPLGIDEDNWPAAVGLFAGILAKEVVIGTLNALYAQSADSAEMDEPQTVESFNLIQRLTAASMTVPKNLAALTQAWRNPVSATLPPEAKTHAYGEMVKRFSGQASAFSYLLFVLLYFPCVSAVAAMFREVQRGWTLFSVGWTTGLAYFLSVLYYQLATITAHPVESTIWILFCLATGGVTFLTIAHYGQKIPKIIPTPIMQIRS